MIQRNTIQRSLTLNAVQKLSSHPTADEIYQEVALNNPSISRATVYRNLKQLVDSNMLLKVKTTDGADHFDHRCDFHYHASCLHCGKVFDVELKHPLNLTDELADTYDFTVSGYDLVFTGTCAKCKKQQNTASNPSNFSK